VTLAEDLDTIERLIRRLQIDWDKFFGGLERKPPYDVRIKLEGLLRLYANSEIRNSTERFRYQSLTARYSILSELWNKRLRAKEEGRAFGAHGLRAEVLPPAPPPPPAAEPPPPVSAAPAARPESEIRVKNPERDVAAVQALYQRFLAERRRTGETAGVKYESFQKLIGQQTQRLLAEKGGQAVDFRLETKDGRVSLKAKVVK
jgi:hypothetical protein